jgi:hypothetical protein
MGGQALGQEPSGSQVSPHTASTAPLPQTHSQSLSLALVQPMGQQESPLTQASCLPASTHFELQVREDPSSFCRVQPICGHMVGQLSAGSQVSPASTSMLPQVVRQSLSLLASQALGQQPSPFTHSVSIPSSTHSA